MRAGKTTTEFILAMLSLLCALGLEALLFATGNVDSWPAQALALGIGLGTPAAYIGSRTALKRTQTVADAQTDVAAMIGPPAASGAEAPPGGP